MLETPPEAPAAVVEPTRLPRGYVPRLAGAQFGMYMAILTPLVGGLSVRIQHLVGVDAAATQLGLVTGTGALFAMVCQPLAGRLSDRSTSRFGMRRPFVVGGVLAMFLALTVCAIAPDVTILLVAWCVAQGAANFAFAGATATVADQVPENKRGFVSGVIGASTPLGILVGSALLSFLSTDFLRFFVPALFALAFGTWFGLRLKDRVRAEPPTEPLGLRSLLMSFVFNPRKNPDFGWAWLSRFFIVLGYGALSGYLTLFLAAHFGMTDTDEQLRFNAIANTLNIAPLMVCAVLGGFLSDRIGRRKPFVLISGLVISGALVVAAFTPAMGGAGLPVLLVVEVVIGIGAGMLFAVDQALCIQLLPNKEDTAKDLGVLNMANTLPTSVSPFLAGVLVIPVGNSLLGGTGYSTWFIVSALFCVIGSLMITRVKSAT
ncbi:MFS transporter [Streptomyces sp. NPDC001858]